MEEDSFDLQGIHLLPVEILITIFEYLPIKDIKNASITCKHWLNASYHTTVLNKSVLVIENNFIQFIECKANILKPLTSYNSVKIKYTDVFLYYMLNDIHGFKNNIIGEGINNINSLRNIFEFLNELENLNSLEINFDTNKRPTPLCCWYETTNLRNQSFRKIHSLKILKISLSGVEVFCYLQFFLDLMPELVHIDLTLTTPGNQICFDETRIQLLKYLNNGKSRIKTLNMNVDSQTEILISTIEGMNLETMSFGQFLNFTDPNKLLHLAMPMDHHSNIDVVCDLFPNLETISVKLCYSQGTIAGLKGLKKLRNLKVCNFGEEFIGDLAEYDSNVLRNLYLIQYHWENMHTFVSLKNLTNLTHLSCESIKLTDKTMQEISKNLINLQHMALQGHFIYDMRLTDFGFTGETESKATFLKQVNPFFKNRNKKIQTGYSISNLKHLKLLHLHISKSSLGDATLTHIMRIKGLEYLYITCCYDRVEDWKSSIAQFKKNCPFLSRRAEIKCVFDDSYKFEPMPRTQDYSDNLFPIVNCIDDSMRFNIKN